MMAKTGRPIKYDLSKHPQLVKWMARSGLTDKEIAKELNIALSTLYEWKKNFPEFSDALKQNKEFIDYLVEDSLLKRALGYEYEETEVTASKKGGEAKPARVKKTKKQVSPDVTACIFWLKNRKPAQWRDVQPDDGGTLRELAKALRDSRDAK